MNQFLRLLFGMGLALTEPRQRHRIYDRVTDKLDDFADQASRGYDAAVDRVERVYRSARGEDHRALASTASFLVGMGIGAGVGVLFAPARGKQTRDAIAEKVERFKGNVSESLRRSVESKTA
jgi:hypothetical protein